MSQREAPAAGLSAAIHLLGDILGHVISDLEPPGVFEVEEQIRVLAKGRRAGDQETARRLRSIVSGLPEGVARAVASAFTVYFDLVNLAEDEHRVATLRRHEGGGAGQAAPRGESIAEAIATLKERGVTGAQAAELVKGLDVELVLTAHPTEARRRTMLSKLQRIASQVQLLNRPDALPRELAAARRAIYAEVAGLWLTERDRAVSPSVTDEVRSGLFFVEEVFWDVVPQIYADLDGALARYYPGVKVEHPWLRLASWIGGDRDGNPKVTAEVTAETLRLHRGLAVEHLRRDLGELSRRLSFSGRRVPPVPELQEWLASRHPLPEHVAYLEERYPTEPYRVALALLTAELAEASRDDMAAHLLSSVPHVARLTLETVEAPLEEVARSLPPEVASDELETVRRQVQIFGLHAARLDIREDSGRVRSAVGEILRALDFMPDFERSDGAARCAMLVDLLARPAPDLARHAGVTAGTAATWSLFELIGRARCVYGPELLGPFVISMAHDAADVLSVLLLARWTGCADGLQIVPLFETYDDLEAAPRVLGELFSVESYREHLRGSGDGQMVMIGYSDSNKENGYLAANWALYQAQEEITRVCDEHGIRLTLFHGRGGTVARGGGPANRAVRAQPPGTVRGRFRLTEQGEIIAARYLNRDLAHRHLEQLASAVLLSSSPVPLEGAARTEWREAMDAMARRAWGAYRELVYETPGFMDFWQAATPIDEIARLHLASRPASRQGGTLDVRRVRAIPWVFSWMQSRFNLAAWYGLGAGLEAGVAQALLREMYGEWAFFRVLIDNAEMALAKADIEIAALYSELVPDEALRSRIFGQIRGEYERTCAAVLSVSGHQRLLDYDPVIQRSVQLRNPYVDPLNTIQVEMLRRLRTLPDLEGPAAGVLREVIAVTISGIAAGLRNTG
jgi:phosphoenolpyruvate carboxylase